jgi:hypothetical protein
LMPVCCVLPTACCTMAHKNIYEKVYTDDRDVVLFWKTHMLYYVKTDRLFNSLEDRDLGARASWCWIDARPCARYNCEKQHSRTARTIAGPRLRIVQEY